MVAILIKGTTTDREMKNWAKERFFTLEQLKRENPGIEKVYSDAFDEAEARGIFYNARYLMDQERFNEARSKLKSISKKSNKYFILYLCSFIPTFCNLICSPVVKRRLTQKLLRLLKFSEILEETIQSLIKSENFQESI